MSDDDILKHLLFNVLGLGESHPLLLSLREHGYETKMQLICISALEVTELNLRLADRALLKIFLEFTHSNIRETGLNFHELSDDFLLDISKENFNRFRSNQLLSSTPDKGPDIQSTPRFRNTYHGSPTPIRDQYQYVTQREGRVSMGSNFSYQTQTINPLMRKSQKILEYPQFNGNPSEWKYFERNFLAAANSQNYGHVLDSSFTPTAEQEEEFKIDARYIFQAFSASWAKGKNYDIVDKHKYTCDGRQVYLDALAYYRNGAFTVIELQEAIHDLVNNKLTHTTHDGASGYNSKFNESVYVINQIGPTLDPILVKCIYFANIQDPTYDTIKDQTSIDKMRLLDIQSLMLKKYTSTLGGRREGAMKYRQNVLQTDSTIEELTEDPSNSCTQLKLSHNQSSTQEPRIEDEVYKALPQVVKEKLNYLSKSLRDIKKKLPVANIKNLRTTEENENPSTTEQIDASIDVDPFQDTLKQFMVRGSRTIMLTRKITVPYQILNQVVTAKYGRLISDSGADTGALSDRYACILSVHDIQVAVDGCHPDKVVSYNLCNGVVAVDIGDKTYLLGLREVPLIPNSIGMLLSELQCRAFGIDIDSKPRCFGGRGTIIVDENTVIPLHLERGLMTCPIRKPTEQEMGELHIFWLTSDQPWDPSVYDEVITSKIPVPLGYQHRHSMVTKTSVKIPDIDEKFLLYRPKEVILATWPATTRLATTINDLNMKRHFKSRFPFLNRNRL